MDVASPERTGSTRRRVSLALFTFASALSLLLCLALVSLWVRSEGDVEGVALSRLDRALAVRSTDGVLGLTMIWDAPATASSARQGWSFWRQQRFRGAHERSLFSFQIGRTLAAPEGAWRFGNRRFISITSPYWLPVLVTALLPARWLWVRRRSRPQNQDGFCASCGYDLTGNVSGVCPECGMNACEARVRRNQRSRRFAVATVTIPLLLLAPSIGRTAADQYRDYAAWKHRLALQQQYLNFTAPGDQVVWTEDPVVARQLSARADYMRVGDCVCFAPLIKEEAPGLRISFNGGPALFLHGRRTADGVDRLVNVGLMALEDCEHLRANVLVPMSNREPELRQAGQSDLIIRRWQDEPITFMIGQPDPADPSHFTIGYSMSGQSGTIDGWLTSAKTVRMQVRDGPAKTLKTSPTSIPFFGGKWGGTPPDRKTR